MIKKVLSLCFLFISVSLGQLQPVVPPELRGRIDAERKGIHDANNIRTMFYNFGMVGDYPPDPLNVDLSVFYSVEVPKGSGLNYSDGITPFVLARIRQRNGNIAHIMETGYRERQGISPITNKVMRFEPRPGYFQENPAINIGRSIAMSNDPRTWPDKWIDKLNDPDDPGWSGHWNGYFGKRPAADQESYFVMDDNFYDAWNFFPDSRDTTRRGLALRVGVRGFQWSNPQAANVIFWHYDITNEGTTDYLDNIIFGLYMDSGVGGSAISCDGIAESDDDNAYFDKSSGLNLVYTWDKGGRGVALGTNCYPTGYLGYAYLETPGNPFDGIDNDDDGITDEKRDGGPGELIIGQDNIKAYVMSHYDISKFEATYGKLESRPAFRAGRWWTGDEDMDWVADLHDTGADGIWGTNDTGEGDGIPTPGEPNFDKTDLHESDQIGLTGFKFNRIRPGQGNPSQEVDDIVFWEGGKDWPRRLYEQFTAPIFTDRFDPPLVANYNIGFLFASGPFKLYAGKTERFSLALAWGGDLEELKRTVKTVQQIYNANYQFAVPPPTPTVWAETGDGYVRLIWDDKAEKGVDPVTLQNDFEGYKIYRSTEPFFLDPKIILNARGTGPVGHGRPIAQFDLKNGIKGYSNQTVEGVAFYLGDDTGIRHSFVDTTVVNGQLYYYAVTSYDHGSDSLGFYPSESAISVSRTLRGGVILPQNVVEVRPEPKVPGYVPASTEQFQRVSGKGIGEIQLKVLNSKLVPEGHLFFIRFGVNSAQNVRADYYEIYDSTTKKVLARGYNLEGEDVNPAGSGILAIVSTPKTIEVDTINTGFTKESKTNLKFKVTYQNVLPINQRRIGFPYDFTLIFDDVPLDTSLPAIGRPSKPVKIKVIAHTDTGDIQLKFQFRDIDNDSTLSTPGEYIDVMTYLPGNPPAPRVTWRIEIDTTKMPKPLPPIIKPGRGDAFNVFIQKPFTIEDTFKFVTRGEKIDQEKARVEAQSSPYVVPNPYVASASFEPERFAVSGRGERRIEFRNIPAKSVIRIYTLKGELVQTLYHDGSTEGYVAWNLRTKDNLDVAPGLYIYHVEAPGIGSFIGKFAIIK